MKICETPYFKKHKNVYHAAQRLNNENKIYIISYLAVASARIRQITVAYLGSDTFHIGYGYLRQNNCAQQVYHDKNRRQKIYERHQRIAKKRKFSF